MRTIFEAFAKNTVFANIVLAMIFVSGAMAIGGMVRETFPEFSLDVITITVPWPGADPEEVEEGITRKIEESIEGIDGIREYNTVSSENFGTAIIEVDEDYDLDYVKDRVRNAVEAISTFPEDAERPVTEELLLRSEVVLVALYGETMTERGLKEWAERIKEEIRSLPEVSQITILGARDYEIGIEVSEERLREYGLTFEQVAGLVRASSLNLTGGTMRTKGEEIRLRTIGRKYTAEEFANIVLLARPNGEVITLDRVAEIRDDFVQDRVISRFNGHPCINVRVLKTSEEDTLAIDAAVRDYVAEKKMRLPEGVHMAVWGGASDILEARISLLVRNGIIGLSLVFILLWLFLDVRLSFWAGMGMPISVMGALAIMWAIGATVNMISLFSLIMVLGIIVDDAIVVGEAIYVARKRGEPMLKAAVDGVCEVGMPVIAAVLTTVVAFVPLAFVEGVMGKFIRILPVVVIACLAISLVECLILLPAHLSHLPDPNMKSRSRNPLKNWGNALHQLTNRGLERFIEEYYSPFIQKALRFRYVSLAGMVAVMLITQGFIQSGLVKFTFFPEIDGVRMTGTVEFPNGTPIDITRQAVEQLEVSIREVNRNTETLSGEPIIKNMYSLVGSTIDDFEPKMGAHLGAVRIEMPDAADRGISTDALIVKWKEALGAVPGAVSVTFQGDEGGPGGAPIEVWVQGHDLDKILAASREIQDKLNTFEGVFQVEDNFRPGKNEMKLELKPEARAMGLSVSDLARQVYAGYFGEEAIRLQRGRDDVRVRVRYPESERDEVAEFEDVRIRTPQGDEVPLLSVADVTYGPGYASITRTNGMRRISVTADIDTAAANANEIFAELQAGFFASLRQSYPGLHISLAGDQREMADSFSSLRYTYPLALLGIFIIIATVFRSYIQPLVILITVPFGMIGAVFGHYLLGFDLSIMSYFGMVALSGVVVNDAIVLIECINANIARGVPFLEAVREGGARRFRAIFLTTLSTVGGLTPLIMEQDLQARVLIPMGLSIAGGVAFATALTLFLIPCLLVILNDLRRMTYWLRRREWPTREIVEPAHHRQTEEEEDDPDLEETPAAPVPDGAAISPEGA